MKSKRECRIVLYRDIFMVEDVHLLLIKFDNSVGAAPVDIGSLCYLTRTVERMNCLNEDGVKLFGLSLSRKRFIFEFIQASHIKGYRQQTFRSKLTSIKSIFSLAESLGCANFLDNQEECRNFYFQANAYYRNTIMNQSKVSGLSKANCLISSFKNIIGLVFGKEYLIKVISNIQAIPKVRRKYVKPAHDSVIVFSIKQYRGLAFGVQQALTEDTPYPFKINLAGGICNLFPSRKIKFEDLHVQHADLVSYQNLSESDLFLINSKENEITEVLKNHSTIRSLEIRLRSNASGRTYYRNLHANWALYCFLKLFLIITGATTSEVINLEYDDKIESQKDLICRNFKTIKYRAKGKVTKYTISTSEGIEIYERYLKLRAWVLNGKSFKYLFFCVSFKKHESIPSVLIDTTRKDFKVFKGFIFPEDFEHLTPTVIRKSKSKILHALKQSTNDVSKNLNHTEKVNERAYRLSDENEAVSEIEVYWRAMRNAADRIKIKEVCSLKDVSISVGHCECINNPKDISSSVPIKPDCVRQYGCLYCDNYTVHADEEDFHKLESVLFVVNGLLKFSAENSEIMPGLVDLSIRINYILKVLLESNDKYKIISKEIWERVNVHGVLTKFWELRLRRYEELGMILC